MKTGKLACTWMALGCAALIGAFATPKAEAVVTQSFTFSGSATGQPTWLIESEATFTFDGADLYITLTNNNPVTFGSDQNITRVRFTLSSGATTYTNLTLTAANAPQTISVNPNGTFTQNGSVNLLSPATWSLDNGTVNLLDFNPDAEYGIIGPETAGSYALANGSITNNGGHDPFIYRTATYKIELPGGNIPENATITNLALVYGTSFSTTLTPVPEPSSVFVFGLGMGLACLNFRGPRRTAKV